MTRLHRMLWIAFSGGLVTATTWVNNVHAQAYPSRPIRLLVPYGAGGGVDLTVRNFNGRMANNIGQPVVVDNRPGASGNIGTEIVARSAADGYTLLAVANTISTVPSLYPRLTYDPIKDFAAVTTLTSYMLFLVVNPSVPVRSVKELIAYGKANSDRLTYASAGNGSTTHLAAELFKLVTGVKMLHVPFKGSGPSYPPLISGEIQLTFGSPSVVTHIKSGRLSLIGVTGAKRSRLYPNVPTIAESGVPGYEATGWNAMFAPAGTPPAIIRRINEEVGKAMAHPDVEKGLAAQELDNAVGPPSELTHLLKTDIDKWAKVIKSAGITIN